MSNRIKLAGAVAAILAISACTSIVSSPPPAADDGNGPAPKLCLEGPERFVEIPAPLYVGGSSDVYINWRVSNPCGTYTTSLFLGSDPMALVEYPLKHETRFALPLQLHCSRVVIRVTVYDRLGPMSAEDVMEWGESCGPGSSPPPRHPPDWSPPL